MSYPIKRFFKYCFPTHNNGDRIIQPCLTLSLLPFVCVSSISTPTVWFQCKALVQIYSCPFQYFRKFRIFNSITNAFLRNLNQINQTFFYQTVFEPNKNTSVMPNPLLNLNYVFQLFLSKYVKIYFTLRTVLSNVTLATDHCASSSCWVSLQYYDCYSRSRIIKFCLSVFSQMLKVIIFF